MKTFLARTVLIVVFVTLRASGQAPLEPLPEVTDVDHAKVIQAWDEAALERGKQFYNTVCFACHGIDGKKVTVQGARAFAVDPLARGTDP